MKTVDCHNIFFFTQKTSVSLQGKFTRDSKYSHRSRPCANMFMSRCACACLSERAHHHNRIDKVGSMDCGLREERKLLQNVLTAQVAEIKKLAKKSISARELFLGVESLCWRSNGGSRSSADS